jgi:hypothetical protein
MALVFRKRSYTRPFVTQLSKLQMSVRFCEQLTIATASGRKGDFVAILAFLQFINTFSTEQGTCAIVTS